MTDFYKNNDDLLRDKLTQHEFGSVPNAWENMSALLDQNQVAAAPKRAAGYWWSIPFVAAAALAGVIGLGAYLHPTTSIAKTSDAPLIVENTKKAVHQTSKQAFVKTNTAQQKTTKAIAPTSTINNQHSNNKEQAVAPVVNVSNKKKAIATNKSKTELIAPIVTKDKKHTTCASKIASVVTEDTKPTNVALENAIQDVATTNNFTGKKPRVKTTRTEVVYQYSITPLRALQSKRKAMEQQKKIGAFGIGDELDTKKSPLKVSVFGGASAKMYRSTKELSVMPYGGVSASYRVAKHHGLQVGLQYKAIGNLSAQRNNGENNALSYTSGSTVTKAHCMTRMDLLEMPLVYQFHPHPSYNIQAGVKGAWLFNTETTAPEFKTNKELGIADFDMSILVGMEYCLNKNWSVGIQYSLGLVNLTQQAESKHNDALQADINNGVDPDAKVTALSRTGEVLVPVANDINQNQMIRLPNQLHNNDLQVNLKYTF